MSDKYDEKAATLVSHCRYCDRDYKCPDDLAQDRAEVAAALREQGAEVERLDANWGRAMAEIVALKAEIAEAEKRGDSTHKGAMIVMACMIKRSPEGEVRVYNHDIVGVDPDTEVVVHDDLENGCRVYRIRAAMDGK